MNDTTLPFWAETPVKGVKASELLANTSIEIWDYDTLDPNDYIGGCALPLTPAVFDGSLQNYVVPGDREHRVGDGLLPHQPARPVAANAAAYGQVRDLHGVGRVDLGAVAELAAVVLAPAPHGAVLLERARVAGARRDRHDVAEQADAARPLDRRRA